MEEDQKHYENLAALLKEKHKRELLAQGEDEKSANRKAEKKAIEDARFVLPNACATKMICTMNAPVPPQLLHPPVLQPGPVGDPCPGGGDAQRGEGRGAPYLREGRPPLPAGELPRGQDELRKDEGGPGKVRVPCDFSRPLDHTSEKGRTAVGLVVLEGLDGSGKGTQAQLLHRALENRGEPVRKVTFPDYSSPSSSLVKMYLNGEFGSDPEDVNAYAASAFYAVDRYASYKKGLGRGLSPGGPHPLRPVRHLQPDLPAGQAPPDRVGGLPRLGPGPGV